jgi:hypothetical protein
MVQNASRIRTRWAPVFPRHMHGELVEHPDVFRKSFLPSFLLHYLRLTKHDKTKLAVSDLRAIGASFSQLITSTMISRLVLNLRSVSGSNSPQDLPTATVPMKFMTRAVGNLGGELETILDDIDESSRTGRHTNTEEITLVDYSRR